MYDIFLNWRELLLIRSILENYNYIGPPHEKTCRLTRLYSPQKISCCVKFRISEKECFAIAIGLEKTRY